MNRLTSRRTTTKRRTAAALVLLSLPLRVNTTEDPHKFDTCGKTKLCFVPGNCYLLDTKPEVLELADRSAMIKNQKCPQGIIMRKLREGAVRVDAWAERDAGVELQVSIGDKNITCNAYNADTKLIMCSDEFDVTNEFVHVKLVSGQLTTSEDFNIVNKIADARDACLLDVSKLLPPCTENGLTCKKPKLDLDAQEISCGGEKDYRLEMSKTGSWNQVDSFKCAPGSTWTATNSSGGSVDGDNPPTLRCATGIASSGGSSSTSDSSNAGLIIAVSCGGFVVLILIIVGGYFIHKHFMKKETREKINEQKKRKIAEDKLKKLNLKLVEYRAKEKEARGTAEMNIPKTPIIMKRISGATWKGERYIRNNSLKTYNLQWTNPDNSLFSLDPESSHRLEMTNDFILMIEYEGNEGSETPIDAAIELLYREELSDPGAKMEQQPAELRCRLPLIFSNEATPMSPKKWIWAPSLPYPSLQYSHYS